MVELIPGLAAAQSVGTFAVSVLTVVLLIIRIRRTRRRRDDD